MQLKNTETGYGAVTKSFHWAMAVLMIVLLVMGTFMSDMENGPDKFKIYGLHKSLGVLVLFLTLCRVLWHIASKKPGAVETLQKWEMRLASVMHIGLYGLLLAMPLTGLIFSAAGNHPVSFFGLFTLPNLVEPDKGLKDIFRWLHENIGTLAMVAVGLHALAALKHHFVSRDIVLKRMLPALLAFVFLGAAPAVAGNTWSLINEKSSITFTSKQMDAEFQGNFRLFSATIAFDPDNLAASSVTAEIDIASVDTQAADRDENIRGTEWFDAAKFPKAKFVTTSFRKTGDNAYEASGNLTIRDVTLPVVLPFKLDIIKGDSDKSSKATMDGSLMLDRSAFKLGGEKWADTSVIANEVKVDVHIIALQRP